MGSPYGHLALHPVDDSYCCSHSKTFRYQTLFFCNWKASVSVMWATILLKVSYGNILFPGSSRPRPACGGDRPGKTLLIKL